MVMVKRMVERAAPAGGRIDRTGTRPVLRGVRLCGPTSANRRRYLKQAFAGDRVKRYEGKPVYLNHGRNRDDERKYEDLVGYVRNARLGSDGYPVGDIEFKKSHPYTAAILEDAEHDPLSVGMSHVVDARTERARDGWDDVHEVREVESCDLVLKPATVKGLFESIGRRHKGGTGMNVRRYFERLARATGRRGLRFIFEDSELADALGAEDMPDDAVDPVDLDGDDGDSQTDDAIAAAFVQAGNAVWAAVCNGGMDPAAGLAKLRKLASALKDAAPTAVGSDTAEESRRGRRPTLDEVSRPRITLDDPAPLTEGAPPWLSSNRPSPDAIKAFTRSIRG